MAKSRRDFLAGAMASGGALFASNGFAQTPPAARQAGEEMVRPEIA